MRKDGDTTGSGTSAESQMPENCWRVIAASVAGASHEKLGLPCQDASKWTALDQAMLVAAVADGVGSAPLAEIGSAIAVESALAYVAEKDCLPRASEDDSVWHSFLMNMLQSVREAIAEEAGARGVTESDLATTAIITFATPEIVAVAQVGDGAAISMNQKGEIAALTIPQYGEYANDVYSVTMPDALDRAQLIVQRGGTTHLALMSDGLQMLALQMPGFVPHAAFFLPLFEFASTATDDADRQSELSSFLRSSRVRERTNDDITLLIASLVSG